ncbi:uracil-DNA glycosylase [Candidatus Woesebacteria bacterium]|nr:uracil-DNA glycosylase [Candidatus Woesebacteria bacterium]
MNKQAELNKLKKQIESCTLCQKDSIGIAVFGEGNPDAKIMFVGEAPGKNEAKSGRPFIGRSGKLLRKCIQDIGLNEKNIYITSPVKYLPERGTPSKEQIHHAKTHFDKQVDIIHPEIIVLLGKTAVFAILEENIPVLTRHGEIIQRNNQSYLITIHPSAALRFPKYKTIIENDFKKITQI